MKALQHWFERLAGVTPDELARLRIANDVFYGRQSLNSRQFDLPACWRRRTTAPSR